MSKTDNAYPYHRDVAVFSQWQLIWQRFRRHRLAFISMHILAALYTMALFCGFFSPYNLKHKNLEFSYSPTQLLHFDLVRGLYVFALDQKEDPITLRKYYVEDRNQMLSVGFFKSGDMYELLGVIETNYHFFGLDEVRLINDELGTTSLPEIHLLGTDRYGRDILSSVLYGARISLSIGLAAIFFTFIIGVSIGGISGYLGGLTDTIIQRIIEIINSFPQLPLWLAIGAIIPYDWPPLRTYFAITLVLSFLNWTGIARVTRGKILSLREEEYIMAARLLGASHSRILFRHLIPGFTSHIIVALTLSVPVMILGETALSFLGLGLRPPVVSWGVMLQDCLNLQVITDYPWMLMPILMIIITVLSFNFMGDGLRDAADPYGH